MMGIRSKIKENMNNKCDSSDVFYTPPQQYSPRNDQTWSPIPQWRTVPPASMELPAASAEGHSQVNVLARALSKVNSNQMLPPPSVVKWDGLRSSFPKFLLHFDMKVERHCESAGQAFSYLLEALPERDQVLISHLADIVDDSGETGYRLAREALETAFGGKHLIEEEAISKLTVGPIIPKLDIRAWLEFQAHMQAAEFRLRRYKCEARLNSPTTLIAIAHRFPGHMLERWADEVRRINAHGRDEMYTDLCDFV